MNTLEPMTGFQGFLSCDEVKYFGKQFQKMVQGSFQTFAETIALFY